MWYHLKHTKNNCAIEVKIVDCEFVWSVSNLKQCPILRFSKWLIHSNPIVWYRTIEYSQIFIVVFQKLEFSKRTLMTKASPKKHTNLVLISTHKVKERNDEKSHIFDHKATNGDLATFDQLFGTYTCKRKSNRGPS